MPDGPPPTMFNIQYPEMLGLFYYLHGIEDRNHADAVLLEQVQRTLVAHHALLERVCNKTGESIQLQSEQPEESV